jgi:hypothetical protein
MDSDLKAAAPGSARRFWLDVEPFDPSYRALFFSLPNNPPFSDNGDHQRFQTGKTVDSFAIGHLLPEMATHMHFIDYSNVTGLFK